MYPKDLQELKELILSTLKDLQSFSFRCERI